MENQSIQPDPTQGHLYLIGVGVTHSIAPPMHNAIAASLSKPWTFSALECPTIDSMLAAFHTPSFIGAVITMPYKQSVILHLSAINSHAALIGAVNNVYLTPSHELRGTNTDWEGIHGCLSNADPHGKGRGKPALVIGAGGASRAAVYALKMEFNCNTIYVINRDESEVTQLLSDTRAYASLSSSSPSLMIIHVTSEYQAESLPKPFYIVGTVPDIEPRSETEIAMRRILEVFLDREGEKGVLLDMCFKPRRTRTLKLAREKGWIGVEGTEVIGHQIGTQWGLWTGEGEGIRGRIREDEAWRVLRREAESSLMIN
jgi:quinate dehydrogenase